MIAKAQQTRPKLRPARSKPEDWISAGDITPGMGYLELVHIVATAIRSDRLSPGTRLPTQRELSARLGINLGTVSRAYTELKAQGLIEARRRSGSFVRAIGAKPQSNGPNGSIIHLGTFGHGATAAPEELGRTLVEIGSDPATMHALGRYMSNFTIPQHRAVAAEWLSSPDYRVDAHQVCLTDCATSGLLAVMMAVCDRADVILVEALMVPGMLSIARRLGLRLVGIPMDRQGVIPEALDELCALHRPRVAVLTPVLQNPTCSLMPDDRKRAVAGILDRHDVFLVEDDVWRGLVPASAGGIRIASLIPERACVVTSLSKSVGPVVRVGVVSVPLPFVARVLDALACQSVSAPNIMVEVLSRWYRTGTLARVTDALRRLVVEREEIARSILGPFGLITQPYASFSWLPMQPGTGAHSFFTDALKAGVQVRYAEEFAVPGAVFEPGVRVNLAGVSDTNQFRAGLTILAELLSQGGIGGERLP